MVVLHQPDPVRVTLRPARPADAERLYAWRAQPSVRRHQPLSDASLADLRTDLARQRPEELFQARGERFQWIIEIDGEPAGWITLAVASWEHGIAEIGYALGDAHQGRGYMAVALSELLGRLFEQTALQRIEARCALGNRASQRVLERLGFRLEGRLRSYFELDGRRIDNWLYSILRDELERN